MNKKSIFTTLLALVAMAGQAQNMIKTATAPITFSKKDFADTIKIKMIDEDRGDRFLSRSMRDRNLFPLSLYPSIIPHPRSMAYQSMLDVPFSWVAIAMPMSIQRWGCCDGSPNGSSGAMAVRRETFWM